MIRRRIIKRERLPSLRRAVNAHGKVRLTLSCGHIKTVPYAEAPKGEEALCKECKSE